MKHKLFLLMFFVMAFVFTGCVNNDDEAVKPAEEMSGEIPHFYGLAMLDSEHETRGVADGLKTWTHSMAQNNLTVKFLNGSHENIAYVKEVAKEWEKNANVKFHWVEQTQSAMIRIKFDVDLHTSWSYTGRDHIALYGEQNKPTMVFAGWHNINSNAQRSDVLRAFGQVLGLELEFRNPDFNVDWLDSTTVYKYWMDKLSAYISWPEMEKYIVNPLSQYTFLIENTVYDTLSVMMWPMYSMIANNLTVLESANQCNTELSTLDKVLIQRLYGPATPIIDVVDLELISFTQTSRNINYMLITTTRDLDIVATDESNPDIKEVVNLTMPTGATSHTFEIWHTFASTKEKNIVIREKNVEVIDGITPVSNALLKFNFYNAEHAKDIDIKDLNKAIQRIYIGGGANFTPQEFNFTGFDKLRELYLTDVLDSRAVISNCPNLEYFSTTGAFYIPAGIPHYNLHDVSIVTTPTAVGAWPNYPSFNYSFKDSDDKPGLVISDCPKLRAILLDNVKIKSFDFSEFKNLLYVCISSTEDMIVGPYPSTKYNVTGLHLAESLSTLPFHVSANVAFVIVRSMVENPDPHFPVPSGNPYQYNPVKLNNLSYQSIMSGCNMKKWNLVWNYTIVSN